MSGTQLPNGATMVPVGDRMHVTVTPANGVFPPRVELRAPARWTPLVPMDRLRDFAETLDYDDRARLLTLLDRLAPWMQPRDRNVQ